MPVILTTPSKAKRGIPVEFPNRLLFSVDMKKWLTQLETSVNIQLLKDRVCEAVRESALLWFVFSVLDKLLVDKLTWQWAATNAALCFVCWSFGTYIEVRKGTS
jgi:hypothetical protein